MDIKKDQRREWETSAEEHIPDELGLKANWNELRGKIKDQYPDLQDEDLEFMNEADMINRLQRKTGKTKLEIRRWLHSISKII